MFPNNKKCQQCNFGVDSHPTYDPPLCNRYNRHMCYIYYTQKIRDSGQQHPIRHVRQCRNANWRKNWTTPWKAKSLANAWEAFLISDSSIFTDEFLQWWKRDLIWFSCKRAATSRRMNHSPWTPNPKSATAQGWRSLYMCASPALSCCDGAGEPEAYIQVTYRGI